MVKQVVIEEDTDLDHGILDFENIFSTKEKSGEEQYSK